MDKEKLSTSCFVGGEKRREKNRHVLLYWYRARRGEKINPRYVAKRNKKFTFPMH